MRKSLVIILSLVLASLASAADIKLTDGHILRNAEVTAATSIYVTIKHQAGIGTFSIDKLTDSDRRLVETRFPSIKPQPIESLEIPSPSGAQEQTTNSDAKADASTKGQEPSSDIEWETLNDELMSLYQQGHYDRAVVVANHAIQLAEQRKGLDHPDVATSLNHLAELYRIQGQYAQAEPLYKRALAIDEKAFGPDHPNVATDLDNLAFLYNTQGQHGRAELLRKRAMAIREKPLDPRHPDATTRIENMGFIDGHRNTNAFEAIQKAEKATVIVYITQPSGRLSQGSGFFVGTNGLLLTNFHVIEAGTKGVIKFRDGSTCNIKHVLNYSAKHDMALLLVATNSTDTLQIADPMTTRSGMRIHTMGAPNGLGWTHTEGIVEGVLNEFDQGGIGVLQHTAKIDHGSSGGPAFDDNGYVHTINTWGRARKVLKSNGKYEIVWDNLRYQGACCQDINSFLKSKQNPQYLPTLAGYYANQEVATWILFACSETDYGLRLMRNSIIRMNTTRKQVLSDRSHNIDGSGKIISDKRYWVDVDQFNNAVQEFEKLKVFIIEQLPLNSASDPAVKKALNDWLTCIISVNEAVDRIVASQGKSTQAFGLACRLVKTDFTRANDFYYEALRTAANVSKKYRSYSTVNSPVTSERITELLKYYYERKLELR